MNNIKKIKEELCTRDKITYMQTTICLLKMREIHTVVYRKL